jgi:hypothetical protein
MAKETPQGAQANTGAGKSAAPALATRRKAPRRSGTRPRSAAASGKVLQDAPAAPRVSRLRAKSEPTGTVTVHARVDIDFYHKLVEDDAPVLGIDGTSALVREGLRLLHKRARELAMAEEYDKFYGGAQAPAPEGVTAIWGD